MRAAVFALLLLPVLLMLWGRQLPAGSSELRFESSVVQPGDSAEVTYVPALALTGEDSVVVRARFRRADDPRGVPTRGHIRPGVLLRGADGEFRGRIHVPEGAVYGILAVESTTSDRVDTNFGRLFDVMVADGAEGRWSLQQKVNDLLRRNWEEAVTMQRNIVGRFPHDALAWKDLFALEQEIVPAANLDSLRSVHTSRLEDLSSGFGKHQDGGHRAADNAAALMWYAILLQDAGQETHWRKILLAADPSHPRSVEHRAFEIASQASSDLEAVAGLERLWQEVQSAHPFLPQIGIRSAVRLKDADLVARWGERFALARPEFTRWVAQQFLAFPELRTEGIQLLIEELEALKTDGRRPLDLDRASWLDETAALRSTIHLEISMGLKRRDRPGSDRHLLRALELDWNSEAYREQAQRLLALGRVDEAVESLVRTAADPGARFGRDSAVSLMDSRVDSVAWAAKVAEARRHMAEQRLDRSISVPLPQDVTLGDESGSRHDLATLLDGRTTVIVYWSPYCGPALDALPKIERLAEQMLPTYDANLLLVTTEPLGPGVDAALSDRAISLETYFDETRVLARTLNQFATPAYYVIDSTGHLRFRRSSLARLPGEVAALGIITQAGGAPRSSR